MARDTHISCIMPCDGYDGISEIAAKHAAMLDGRRQDGVHEAHAMLRHLAADSGVTVGHKGGLFTWGIVGNYTAVEAFIGALKPFWLEIYRHPRDGFDGPLSHEHIIVFFEAEQSERAQAFEVAYDEDKGEISVTHHKGLPFAWMQF